MTAAAGWFVNSAINLPPSTQLASAGTSDIGAVPNNFVHLTGSATVTSFGTRTGARRIVIFDAGITLTNSASLRLLSNSNRTTKLGDIGSYVSDDAGIWTELAYAPSSVSNPAVPTDIASASTVDIGSIPNNNLHMTGSATVSSFGTVRNQIRIIRFEAGITLVNSGQIRLISLANRTTVAADYGVYLSDNAGNWTELAYVPPLAPPVTFPGLISIEYHPGPASTSVTAPAGATRARIRIQGGGGPAGASAGYGGGYAEQTLNVTAGAVYPLVVGGSGANTTLMGVTATGGSSVAPGTGTGALNIPGGTPTPSIAGGGATIGGASFLGTGDSNNYGSGGSTGVGAPGFAAIEWYS